MKRMKIILSFVIILFIPFTISGCWDYTPLESNYTVTGLGIDVDENSPDKILVSFVGPGQKKNNAPSSSNGNSGSSTSQDTYYYIKATGNGIRSAALQAQNKTNQNLSINNLRVIVFSKEIAKKGIAQYIDPFLRNAQINPNTLVIVTNGTAKELLNFKSELISKIPMFLIDLINSSDYQVKRNFFTLREVTYALNSDSNGFILPYITFNPKEKEIIYEQVCLFKEDKMVDVLPESETISYFLVNRILKRDEYSLDEHHTENYVNNGSSFYLIPKNSKIITNINSNNEITFKVLLKIRCDTTEKILNNSIVMNSKSNNIKNDYKILQKKYEQEIALLLKQSISKLLNRLQISNKVDPIGFGEYVRVKYPDYFKTISWPEEYAKAKFNIDISVKIENSGILKLEYD